ncbi:nucleoside phosphorylase [Robertkochia aurantiaca]|uniref:nucleoside phosphorylase n=1 Tax=Robertkochia aurantiaca TaxID=2873700 RepID=UPI001CCE2680|nr:nucleoside phosphorylase [Robertkochia sp. 3YJGBD-33]
MNLKASELILNPDGSIYHLNLLPEDIGDTIILVGDPGRVKRVSDRFDSCEIKKQKREFVTHTGFVGKKRVSVISTGIGTDNIDIVINELDALANIDFDTRTNRKQLRQLDLIRIGTSGSLQKDIGVDEFLLSQFGLGFDNLLHFYKSEKVRDLNLESAVKEQLKLPSCLEPYAVEGDRDLRDQFASSETHIGCTATNCGFYGPQGRKLRLDSSVSDLPDLMSRFEASGLRITNMEMETAGIYGMSAMLNHRALSANVILANRPLGTFSEKPGNAVDRLITYILSRL